MKNYDRCNYLLRVATSTRLIALRGIKQRLIASGKGNVSCRKQSGSVWGALIRLGAFHGDSIYTLNCDYTVIAQGSYSNFGCSRGTTWEVGSKPDGA